MNEMNEQVARNNVAIAPTFESARTLLEFALKPLWRKKTA